MKKLLSVIIGAMTIATATPALAGGEVYVDSYEIAPWAVDAVNILNEANCMIGYPDGSFRPAQDITRQELAVTLQGCLASLSLYVQESDNVIVQKVQYQYDLLMAEIAAQNIRLEAVEDYVANEKKDRDHYVGIGLGLASDDMSESLISVDAKFELVELGDFSLSARPGVNSAYEAYLGATVDFDISDDLEVYAGGGGAIRMSDAQSGVLTSGKGDGEAVGYVQGGLALDLSNRTAITLDAKYPITDANETGVVVTLGGALKF